MIDRELGAAAVAGLADVKALRKQRVEHARGGLRDLGVAADQADAVARADLLARAGDRRFQKAQLVAYPRRECGDAVWVAGRGAKHDLVGRGCDECMLDHVLDLIGIEHRQHDRFAALCDLDERARAAADRLKVFAPGRIDVKADHGKSRGDQPSGIDFAHEADADQADGGGGGHWCPFEVECGDILLLLPACGEK